MSIARRLVAPAANHEPSSLMAKRLNLNLKGATYGAIYDATHSAESLLASIFTDTNQAYGTIYTSNFTFFFGDLNYRISLEHPTYDRLSVPTVVSLIAELLQALHPYDQLAAERGFERTLHGFREGPLNFPPTYKFKLGQTNGYAFGSRTPSWCDRILFSHRVVDTGMSHPPETEPIVTHVYTSHMSYYLSDHKPVSGLFTIFPSALGPLAGHFRSPYSVDPRWKLKRDVGLALDRLVGWLWLGCRISGGIFIVGFVFISGWLFSSDKRLRYGGTS